MVAAGRAWWALWAGGTGAGGSGLCLCVPVHPCRHGQLGHGTLESELQPRLLEALAGVPMQAVAAGGWHSASVSGKGLGCPGSLRGCWQRLALLGPALGDMGCWCPWNTQCCLRGGLRAKLCLRFFSPHPTEAGDLYVWGWNESGQLALPSKALAEERVQDEDTGAGGCCWPG